MKPIIEINHKERGSPRDDRAQRSHQNFPLTDYNYRPIPETQMGFTADQPAAKLPGFHKLSSEFLGAERSRDYVAELAFFILMTGLAAWPVMSMLIAVIRMIRNY